MIDFNTIKRLETEADRLRTKYNPKTTIDLEKIAKEEYGVISIIKTPLAYNGSIVIEDKNNILYIFYDAAFKLYEPLAVGHEIGHIAAGHFNGHRRSRIKSDIEADYFSAKLNGVSLIKLYLYSLIDAYLSPKENFLYLLRRKREIERLKQKGVYHIIEQIPKRFL